MNEDRIKRINFINKRLRQKNEARAHIKNVDEAIGQYHRAFVKEIKPLPPVPQLSDFYHPLEGQKNCELLFVTVCTCLETYDLYKYLT